MLSCLVIYLTQPFAQGDWITLEQGQDGWAEEIGLFYTNLDLQKANRVALEGKVFFQVPHAADFGYSGDLILVTDEVSKMLLMRVLGKSSNGTSARSTFPTFAPRCGHVGMMF